MSEKKILNKISSQKDTLRRFGIRRIGLFGSYVRGEASANSDLDILVEFNPTQKTFRNFMEAAFYIEKLTGKSVDLVTPQALSPYLKPYILKDIRYVEIAG